MDHSNVKLMLKHGAKLEPEIVSYYDMVKLNALYHEAAVKMGISDSVQNHIPA